jgi:Holliday junction DNA helicase RuvA
MISTLRGEVLEINNDNLTINLGGLGLRVYVTSSVCLVAKTGDLIFLYTHLIVREDALTLYGFDLREERDFFLVLLGVDGIGPRIALAVLSTLTLDTIRQAVSNGQAEVFCRVSGIGKKTAQKMLLHLEDKVGSINRVDQLSSYNEIETELIAALTGLGYSIVESQAAIQAIPKDTEQDIEAKLRAALSYFTR